MGRNFDQWLSRPSTHRLLRALISAGSLQHRAIRGQRLLCASAPYTKNQQAASAPKRSKSKYIPPFRRLLSDPSSVSTTNVGEHIHARLLPDAAASTIIPQFEDSLQGIVDALTKHEFMYLDKPGVWLSVMPTIQRRYGRDGVLSIWKTIRSRKLDIPVDGEHAAALWTAFVTMSFCEEADNANCEAGNDVMQYAKELKERADVHYPGLYKLMVGSSFRQSPTDVEDWDAKLTAAGMRPFDALKQISTDVLLTKSFSTFDKFAKLYRIGKERDLYDVYMPQIAGTTRKPVALEWHRLFVNHGDEPGNKLLMNQIIQDLIKLDKSHIRAQPPLHGSLADAKLDASNAGLRTPHIPMTRADFNSIIGDVHGIKPKDISDEFCARLFATRAFSVNFVTRSLNILGVESVGPVTIRQIALRTATPTQFGETICSLRKSGISPRDHPFTKLVSVVNNNGNLELWWSLLNSDVHPEAYEETKTLEAILQSQLQSQLYVSAHLTLLALRNANLESRTQGWNILLQHYATAKQHGQLLDCLQTVRGNGIQLTKTTLALLHRAILPQRQTGKRYAKSSVPAKCDPLAIVTQAFMYAAETGTSVNVRLWREQLKRYGMDHRWEDAERLTNWLLRKYKLNVSPTQKQGTLTLTQRRKSYMTSTFLGSFLDKQTQGSLLTWALRTAGVRDQLRPLEPVPVHSESHENLEPHAPQVATCEPWVRGLALLKRLRDHGVWLDMGYLRKVFILRMWILFGPGVSDRKLNNEARIANKLSLAHYIRHANEVFNDFIYWIPEELLKDEPSSNKILLTTLFGKTRFNKKRQEHVNVEAWAAWLSRSKHDFLREPPAIAHRIELWKRSRFRRVASRAPSNAEFSN